MDNIKAWDMIFTMECRLYMYKVSGESEDDETVEKFFNHIVERVGDYRVLYAVAEHWKKNDTQKQIEIAVEQAGMYHISRFMMLMEYMNSKIEKGKLRLG